MIASSYKLRSRKGRRTSLFFFREGAFDFKIRAIARGELLSTRLPSQLIAKIKLGEHSQESSHGLVIPNCVADTWLWCVVDCISDNLLFRSVIKTRDKTVMARRRVIKSNSR